MKPLNKKVLATVIAAVAATSIFIAIFFVQPLLTHTNNYTAELVQAIKRSDEVKVYFDDMASTKLLASYSMHNPNFKNITEALSSVTDRGDV